MSVCVYSVFVLSCAQAAALRRADFLSKESYLLCIDLGTEKVAKVHNGCGAIDRRDLNLEFALQEDTSHLRTETLRVCFLNRVDVRCTRSAF
jgi:hypothetical protein